MNKRKWSSLSEFERAYFKAISFTDSDDWQKDSQFSDELIEQARRDCAAFMAEYGWMIREINSSQAGHDFWLTRNHEGAGFWDSPEVWGEYTDALTAAAQTFPELNTYDHNGLVYFA